MDDKTFELGNGNYLRVDPTGGATVYNDDNIVCLNDRQTGALKDALLASLPCRHPGGLTQGRSGSWWCMDCQQEIEPASPASGSGEPNNE